MKKNHIVTLKDVYKKYSADQEKICAPDETVKRVKEKLKSVDIDILSYTERIDNGRIGIPVYFSVCGKDAFALTNTKKQMGKGASESQAEASAVMELIERYSFFSFDKNENNFFLQNYNDIKEKDKIGFEDIAKSVGDYDDLEIKKRIFEDIPFRWTKAFNLTKNKEVLIPFDWFFSINEFNGACAGNCVEEAIIQGLCEVAERHNCAYLLKNKIKASRIDYEKADDVHAKEMISKYKKEGIKLIISDLTLDIKIPTISVLAIDEATFPLKSEIVWTAGTCANPLKALNRSLTETAQLAGDFDTSARYVASGLFKPSNLSDAKRFINEISYIDIKSIPDLSNDNLRIEAENLISAFPCDIIAVNTTHPLLDIPAFYVIAPGTMFRERSGAGAAMFCAKHIANAMSPQKALSKLKNIDKMLPEKYYIQFYMGLLNLQLNDIDTAYKYFEKAEKLDPLEEDAASIYSYMGECLKNKGDYEKAIEVLKKGEKNDKERTDIYNFIGFCYFKLKKHEDSIKYFEKSIRLDPSSAIDYANIASNYRELKDTEKAILYYEKALDINPFLDFALDNLLKLKGSDE